MQDHPQDPQPLFSPGQGPTSRPHTGHHALVLRGIRVGAPHPLPQARWGVKALRPLFPVGPLPEGSFSTSMAQQRVQAGVEQGTFDEQTAIKAGRKVGVWEA